MTQPPESAPQSPSTWREPSQSETDEAAPEAVPDGADATPRAAGTPAEPPPPAPAEPPARAAAPTADPTEAHAGPVPAPASAGPTSGPAEPTADPTEPIPGPVPAPASAQPPARAAEPTADPTEAPAGSTPATTESVAGLAGTPAYPAPGSVPPAPSPWPAVVAVPEQPLATIGDIHITPTTAVTPHMRIPLRGSTWFVQDYWTITQKIPTWAIVATVVGFFCLTFFSLLFLLAKQNLYSGIVQVTVTNGGQQHTTRIPVSSQAQVEFVHQQVNWARSLAV